MGREYLLAAAPYPHAHFCGGAHGLHLTRSLAECQEFYAAGPYPTTKTCGRAGGLKPGV
jgi:hypothetical protein